MKSSFIGMPISPKLYMKLFDALVKPIALYGCEIWGAFGHKPSIISNICKVLYTKDTLPYEQLHLKACKESIRISKHASNFGIRSELGRLPLMYNVFCAICKYRMRLEAYGDDDILFHALKSQQELTNNSYKSMTYYTFSDKLMNKLNIMNLPSANLHTVKNGLMNAKTHIKDNCRKYYVDLFHETISELKTNEESKLSLYSSIKTCYRYEPYLDYHPGCIYLAKFRLSVHYLPIERGRYHIPKLPRDMRICTFCKTGVGDEIHALFECQNEEMKSYNDQYIARMEVISSQISHLSNKDKFIYIMKGIDLDILKITCEWLCKIDNLYKKNCTIK